MLNKAVLQKLDDLLGEKLPHIFGVPFLHGFFTALLISPKLTLPSQFLPALGMSEDDDVEWKSEKEMNNFMKRMFDLYNDVAHDLGNDQYEPLLSIDTFGVNVVTGPFWWSQGFMVGLETADLKLEETQGETIPDSLIPIMFFAAPPTLSSAFMQKKHTRQEFWTMAADYEALLGQSVMELAALWRTPVPEPAAGHGARNNIVSFPKTEPNRNQPCPCGSGKKYKHCCGKTK